MENIRANHLPQWMVKLFDETGQEREFQNWDNEVTESTRPLIKWLATTDFNNLPAFSGKTWVKTMKDENLTSMTEGRVRASLNILKDSYFGLNRKNVRSGTTAAKPYASASSYPAQAAYGSANPSATTSSASATVEYQSKGYDFSDIPDGRFALHLEGEWKFYIVTTLKRSSWIPGRYQWTKFGFRRGGFRIEVGERTFRRLRGDTKELVGFQTAGESYRGDEEDWIGQILENPIQARVDYGRESGRCGYCGRTLTDELSTQRGIGPDCWEDKHIPHMIHMSRSGKVQQ